MSYFDKSVIKASTQYLHSQHQQRRNYTSSASNHRKGASQSYTSNTSKHSSKPPSRVRGFDGSFNFDKDQVVALKELEQKKFEIEKEILVLRQQVKPAAQIKSSKSQGTLSGLRLQQQKRKVSNPLFNQSVAHNHSQSSLLQMSFGNQSFHRNTQPKRASPIKQAAVRNRNSNLSSKSSAHRRTTTATSKLKQPQRGHLTSRGHTSGLNNDLSCDLGESELLAKPPNNSPKAQVLQAMMRKNQSMKQIQPSDSLSGRAKLAKIKSNPYNSRRATEPRGAKQVSRPSLPGGEKPRYSPYDEEQSPAGKLVELVNVSFPSAKEFLTLKKQPLSGKQAASLKTSRGQSNSQAPFNLVSSMAAKGSQNQPVNASSNTLPLGKVSSSRVSVQSKPSPLPSFHPSQHPSLKSSLNSNLLQTLPSPALTRNPSSLITETTEPKPVLLPQSQSEVLSIVDQKEDHSTLLTVPAAPPAPAEKPPQQQFNSVFSFSKRQSQQSFDNSSSPQGHKLTMPGIDPTPPQPEPEQTMKTEEAGLPLNLFSQAEPMTPQKTETADKPVLSMIPSLQPVKIASAQLSPKSFRSHHNSIKSKASKTSKHSFRSVRSKTSRRNSKTPTPPSSNHSNFSFQNMFYPKTILHRKKKGKNVYQETEQANNRYDQPDFYEQNSQFSLESSKKNRTQELPEATQVSAHFIQPENDLSKMVDRASSVDDGEVLRGDHLQVKAKAFSGQKSSSSERFANFMREAQLNENENSFEKQRASSVKNVHKSSSPFRPSSSVKIHNSDTERDDDELQLFEKLEQRVVVGATESKRTSKQLQSLRSLGSLRHNKILSKHPDTQPKERQLLEEISPLAETKRNTEKCTPLGKIVKQSQQSTGSLISQQLQQYVVSRVSSTKSHQKQILSHQITLVKRTEEDDQSLRSPSPPSKEEEKIEPHLSAIDEPNIFVSQETTTKKPSIPSAMSARGKPPSGMSGRIRTLRSSAEVTSSSKKGSLTDRGPSKGLREILGQIDRQVEQGRKTLCQIRKSQLMKSTQTLGSCQYQTTSNNDDDTSRGVHSQQFVVKSKPKKHIGFQMSQQVGMGSNVAVRKMGGKMPLLSKVNQSCEDIPEEDD